MSRTLCPLALLLALETPQSLATDPSPHDIVKRALAACGYKPDNRPVALCCRYKASEPGDRHLFVVEAMGDAAGTGARMTLTDGDGSPGKFAFGIHRGKAWVAEGGRAKDAGGRELAMWLSMQHSERVTWLVPLLADPRFTLAYLGEDHSGAGVLQGVRVEYPGRKDVRLYFDRQTGLLHRAHSHWDEGGRDLRLVQEFRDYRTRDWGADDEALLRKAGIATDERCLLDYLRDQTPRPGRDRQVAALVRQLGDDSFAARQRAERALRSAGRLALPLVRRAARGRDPEVARRASNVLERIGAAARDGQVLAAVRTVARKRPAGAAEVLLDYLCGTDGDDERREAQAALAAVAFRGGEPEPVLERALEGPQPARGFAAAALGDDGGAYAARPGRRLYLPNLKVAHRVVFRKEGEEKDFFEMRLVGLQAFNALEEKLFARPATPEDSGPQW